MTYLNNNTTAAQAFVFHRSGLERLTHRHFVRIFSAVTMEQVCGASSSYDDSFDNLSFDAGGAQSLTEVGKCYLQASVRLKAICSPGQYLYIIVDSSTNEIVARGLVQMPSSRTGVAQGNPANLKPAIRQFNQTTDLH